MTRMTGKNGTKKKKKQDISAMKNVHIILQGKGGVGKSLIATFLCQFLMRKVSFENVLAIDTDPVNQSLAGYTALNATVLDIKNGDQIDQLKFDQLIDIIAAQDENKHIVVDNGASSFIPLCSWMIENHTVEILRTLGAEVYFHSVITGGMGMFDTMNGLSDMALQLAHPKSIVVWLNEYYGPIVGYEPDGSTYDFEEFSSYRESKDKIRAIVRIPNKSPQTFGVNLEQLFTKKMLFAHGIDDTRFTIMARQRLSLWWEEMCAQLEPFYASIV